MTPVPFEIVCDSSDRTAWLAERRRTIGASESAIVLGFAPESWGSALELWAVKTGQMEPRDLQDNEAVFWGNKLEPSIIDGFHERTRRVSVPFGLLLRSKRWPWLSATPDALTTDDPRAAARMGELRRAIDFLRAWKGAEPAAFATQLREIAAGWWPLQVKNIGFQSAHHWADGVPIYYSIQCTQEALVWGADKCTGAALIAGQRLAWDDVEVPPGPVLPPLAGQIVNLTRQFWDDYVRAGTQPPPDASDSAKHALAALYPEEDPGLVVELGMEQLELARELDAIAAQKSSLEKREKHIKNLIRAAMGDATAAYFADHSGFTLKTVSKQGHTVAAHSYRDLRRKKAKGD